MYVEADAGKSRALSRVFSRRRHRVSLHACERDLLFLFSANIIIIIIIVLSFRTVCRRRQIVLMTLSRTICRELVCGMCVCVWRQSWMHMKNRCFQMVPNARMRIARAAPHTHTYRIDRKTVTTPAI